MGITIPWFRGFVLWIGICGVFNTGRIIRPEEKWYWFGLGPLRLTVSEPMLDEDELMG